MSEVRDAYSDEQWSLEEAVCDFPRLHEVLIIHEQRELWDALLSSQGSKPFFSFFIVLG